MSFAAMCRSDFAPDACTSAMIGRRSAARSAAIALRFARP